jgi:hypothetical protein
LTLFEQAFHFILENQLILCSVIPDLKKSLKDINAPMNEVDFKEAIPSSWYGCTGKIIFQHVTSNPTANSGKKKNDNNKPTVAEKTLKEMREVPDGKIHPLLLKEDCETTLKYFFEVSMSMMKNRSKRPLSMRINNIGSAFAILGGSSALFGDQSAQSTSQSAGNPTDLFKGKEIPRISLGLIIEENAIVAYRIPLLEKNEMIGSFRTNLAAQLKPFVRSVQVPKTPAATNSSPISHYFFPDGIDFVTEPVNKDIVLDDQCLPEMVEEHDLEPEKERRARKNRAKIGSVGDLKDILLQSPTIKLPTGSMNPRVAKCVINLLKVSFHILSDQIR